MPVSVEKVENRGQLRQFIDLPFKLYSDDPNWVPPVKFFQRELLNRDKHPFHRHAEVEYYLARDGNGRVRGRIASIVNHAHNEYHSERTGFFGFLEMENDPELASALLTRCEETLRSAGMSRIRGPMNFSTNEECGMLVKGFDGSPLIMMTYNPEWYPVLMEACGYGKAEDLFAYKLYSALAVESRMARVAELVRKRSNAVMRDISVSRIHQEVPLIMDIYNECWQDNWGFVPMTRDELSHMADELKAIMVSSMAPILEVDGQAVAFAISLPDANQAMKKAGGSLLKAILALKVPLFRVRMDRSRVLLLGVRKAYRGRGFEALLIDRIISSNVEQGVVWGELSWILEDNVSMRRILERDLKAEQYRTYRIYEKEL
jgi:GNAT superfamily N-acetyltransferase